MIGKRADIEEVVALLRAVETESVPDTHSLPESLQPMLRCPSETTP
jgi:hypothetical protein